MLVQRLENLMHRFNPNHADHPRAWPIVADLHDAAMDREYQEQKKKGKVKKQKKSKVKEEEKSKVEEQEKDKVKEDPRDVIFYRWGEDTSTWMKTINGTSWVNDSAKKGVHSIHRDGQVRR